MPLPIIAMGQLPSEDDGTWVPGPDDLREGMRRVFAVRHQQLDLAEQTGEALFARTLKESGD
jgi:hypothetical protein